MSITEFELPSEFEGESYEKILAEMLGNVPDYYDKLEGGFVFDMVAPAAFEAAELINFWLPLGMMSNFHMWARGDWLDYHAADCGLSRREATPAYGDLTVETTAEVTFPSGFVFSVPSENGEPAIDFEVVNATTINQEGTIRVKAVISGKAGNVAADTVTIMKTPYKNVKSIKNLEAFIGGTEPEDDESLRERIDDFYAGRSSSFVGNCADYRRWAQSVAGVGYVNVIPTPNGVPNTVKILLADSNGDQATDELCTAVEKYIFGGKSSSAASHTSLERLAPIGLVDWSVEPFETTKINLKMDAVLATGYPESVVKKNIKAALAEYFKTLADDELRYGTLYYVKVSSVLTEVAGLEDFANLKIGIGSENVTYGTSNVTFDTGELPIVGEISL